MTAPTGVQPAYRIDGASVARETFYAAACDPRQSVAVEACAGAGKTWMLVSRILRALLDGAEPHEILAITFTRKAAGEMRTRLRDWLLAFAAPHCDDATRVAELRARGLDSAEARALAPALGGLYERLLLAGRSVEIRTFHAWFSQLLRAAPIELLAQLGLHAEMEIVDDLAEHRPRILRRFHAAVLADPMLERDYHALVRDRGRTQLRKWLDATWDKRIEIELADAAGTLEPSVPPAHRHWPEHGALAEPTERLLHVAVDSQLRDAAAAMAHDRRAVCRRQGEALGQALAIDDPSQRFRQARAALFTNEGKPRQNIDAAGVVAAIELLEQVHRAFLQQSAHDEHLRMVRLARVLIREATSYKRSRGLADMADLERCALALLRDTTLSGWVQERLDLRVRHLLIDEFQDTSPLQWQALQAWLSGYAGAGGGPSGQRPPGVFIVGDPKQSIYRFRRAEPRVFDAACEFVRDGLGGSVLACDHTRRNAPEVLAVINTVFAAAQQRGEYSGFRAHTTEQRATEGAGVFALARLHRPEAAAADAALDTAAWRDSLTRPRIEAEERVREPEAGKVAAVVRELVASGGFAAGSIQVLCRKRESLRLVAASLAAVHVPYAAAEDFVLVEAIEARDLIAVLDVVASPRHTLSLAHALRSPLFGASDDDLIALAAAAPHGDWWRVLMRSCATRATSAAPGSSSIALPSTDRIATSAALCRAANLLERWHDAARTLPPHDLLDRIVAEGEFRERVAVVVGRERRDAALGAIDALLGLALTLDGARYATPYNFVRALKRRAIKVTAPTQPDAVQLLTVHGAKGLEARAVFVMDADPEPKQVDAATLLVDWPVESAFPIHCAFIYSELNCPPSLEPVRDREFAARRREELNGLYVAMTRARERLVFSATEPYRRTGEPTWWQRVEGAVESLADPVAAGPVAAAGEAITIASLPHWNDATAPAAAVAHKAAADDDESRRLGKAVHRVLEWAAPSRSTAVAAAVDLPALAVAAAREFGVAVDDVTRFATRIWTSSACTRFFAGAALRWSGNEVDVTEAGEVLRIDRLVALDEQGARVWWVLDYKLRQAPELLASYREQLLRYRRAVQRLQPGDTVRCAFISGDGALIEIGEEAALPRERRAEPSETSN